MTQQVVTQNEIRVFRKVVERFQYSFGTGLLGSFQNSVIKNGTHMPDSSRPCGFEIKEQGAVQKFKNIHIRL